MGSAAAHTRDRAVLIISGVGRYSCHAEKGTLLYHVYNNTSLTLSWSDLSRVDSGERHLLDICY